MRTLRTLLATSLTVALAFAGLAAAAPASADPPPQPFSVQNGTFYHYVRESGTPFSSITGSIQSGWYSSRGASDIRIYCPYESTGEFRGVPATDYFTTNASTGSVADFETMVDTAHAAGMTVTMYVSLILVDPSMDEFVLAQQQRAAGQSTATTQLFRWADDDAGATPEFGGWEWSDVAQEYYATSFGYPALDFANQVTRDYAKGVLTFWLDRGVDGFEYDAPQASWGLTDADAADIMVDTPNAHGGTAKWLTAESSIANFDDPYSDSIGLTHTLFNGDDDLGSFAYDVMDGTRSADDLESHFATYLDPRRASGRGMNAAASYDLSRSASQRALDAAVTAGNGVLYSTDVEQVYSQLSDASRAAYDEVFRAIDSSSALAPDASRERVPTGADPQSYATLRTSADGSESVLAVYNFRDVAATISASLTGLDVTVPQTPTNLVTGQAAPQIASSSYAVSLPAYGYVFLDVERGAGTQPWTTVEDTAAGWTYQGYSPLADPGASGGASHVSESQGAYGQLTVAGSELQIVGWRGPDGGTLELFVDGVSRGTAQQQSPTETFSAVLFSVSALSPGDHLVRLQQVSPTGAGWTQIDVVRSR